MAPESCHLIRSACLPLRMSSLSTRGSFHLRALVLDPCGCKASIASFLTPGAGGFLLTSSSGTLWRSTGPGTQGAPPPLSYFIPQIFFSISCIGMYQDELVLGGRMFSSIITSPSYSSSDMSFILPDQTDVEQLRRVSDFSDESLLIPPHGAMCHLPSPLLDNFYHRCRCFVQVVVQIRLL